MAPLPLPNADSCAIISTSLSLVSALVRSVGADVPASAGRGHGSHDVMEDSVLERVRDAFKPLRDAFRLCEKAGLEMAVCGRGDGLLSGPSWMSLMVDEVSSER